jgi:hypothetical protein
MYRIHECIVQPMLVSRVRSVDKLLSSTLMVSMVVFPRETELQVHDTIV